MAAEQDDDITDRKRMEAQLLLADRMASVGTLAAGVAHEINNPLACILSNLDFALDELRRGAPASDDVLRAIEEAKEGGVRVREIVRDLKTFSRAQAGARQVVDLRKVIESAASLAQNEIRRRARLLLDLGEVPTVLGSEQRIGQVILNLLINAAQAIPDGQVDVNRVEVRTWIGADGRARVEISDTGSGIPPEILGRIFDPFFTTKPVGVGTGLGLAICHGIVTELGGEIAVLSELGKGTTFTVTFPAASDRETTATRPCGDGSPVAG